MSNVVKLHRKGCLVRRQRCYLRINVAIRAISADVHLVLCGFLVHRIVKVDAVGVLHAPVSPYQHCTKHQQGYDRCRGRDESEVVLLRSGEAEKQPPMHYL